MKIAITGAAGQLGSLVLLRLAALPDVKEIVALDLRAPPVLVPKLTVVRADVRDDDLHEHFQGCDAVIHLAFLIMQRVVPDIFHAINVEGSRNVFNAAIRAGVTSIVYTSSIAAYGVVHGHPVPITEDSERKRQRDFPYSEAKWLVEESLDELESTHPDVKIARFRPSILIGRRMPHLPGQMLTRRRLVEFGGDAPPPLVWDEDVADAIVLAVQNRAQGAFNLGTLEPKTSRELAELAPEIKFTALPRFLFTIVTSLLAFLSRLRLLPSQDTSWFKVADAHMQPAVDKAINELGWEPTCKTAAEVVQKFLSVTPSRPDPRIAWFMKHTGTIAQTEGIRQEMKHVHLRINLEITGTGGGDYRLSFQEGGVRTTPGRFYPPDASLLVKDTAFLDLLAGRLDPNTAEMTGKIRFRGEPTASIFFVAMVRNFRSLTEESSVRGWFARRLSTQCAQGLPA